MKAGLLAEIILGESPNLKGLVRFFNLLVLDTNGRITGFNNHFILNLKKEESQIIDQPFVRLFDSDEGKADLHLAIKQALKGKPGSISFYSFESRIVFKGVVLPVYGLGHQPSGLIIISKEVIRNPSINDEIEDFWALAKKMIAEAGISTQANSKVGNKIEKQEILLLEDHEGLIFDIFKPETEFLDYKFRFTRSTEDAVLESEKKKPGVLITNYCPKGHMNIDQFTIEFKRKFDVSIIFLGLEDNHIRIEDGWLDIRLKYERNVVIKILELISQLYW